MADTIRQDIEQIIGSKQNPNGDGGLMKNNGLDQYYVNFLELALIQTQLITYGGTFVEEFFCLEGNKILVWNHEAKQFVNKTTGSPFYIPLFFDDFSDLVQSALDWTFANGTGINDWVFGSANPAPQLTDSMYISDDAGVSNAYSSGAPNATISHASTDIIIPAGQSVKVEVQILSNGEPAFDDLRIFAYDSATVPVADVSQNLANQNLKLTGQSGFVQYEFLLPSSFTDTTMTLSFQWQNNGSTTNDPPANVGRVRVSYN